MDIGAKSCVTMDKWIKGNPADPRDVSFIDICSDVIGAEKYFSRQFDIIVMQHVLDEIFDWKAALKSIHAMLDIGGRAYIEVPLYNDMEIEKHPSGEYGNHWKFGGDYLRRNLEDVFQKVILRDFIECGWTGHIFECESL